MPTLPAANPPSVRLPDMELEQLEGVFERVLGDDATARVYLFGSRCKVDAVGGDLDLLVVSERAAEHAYRARKALRLAIHEALGEQKVDILISAEPENPAERALVRLAYLEGVQIWP